MAGNDLSLYLCCKNTFFHPCDPVSFRALSFHIVLIAFLPASLFPLLSYFTVCESDFSAIYLQRTCVVDPSVYVLSSTAGSLGLYTLFHVQTLLIFWRQVPSCPQMSCCVQAIVQISVFLHKTKSTDSVHLP